MTLIERLKKVDLSSHPPSVSNSWTAIPHSLLGEVATELERLQSSLDTVTKEKERLEKENHRYATLGHNVQYDESLKDAEKKIATLHTQLQEVRGAVLKSAVHEIENVINGINYPKWQCSLCNKVSYNTIEHWNDCLVLSCQKALATGKECEK